MGETGGCMRWMAFFLVVVGSGASAGGEDLAVAPAATQPVGAVVHWQQQDDDPAMSLHIVTVDLTDRGVQVRVVPAGEDPDGAGPWETRLATVRSVADREGFAVAINGGFFAVRDEREIMGRKVKYFTGNAANFSGVAISDGRVWSDEPGRPLLVIDEEGRAMIDTFRAVPEGTRQAVAGNAMLLRGGRPLPQRNNLRHPRTAVGVNQEGTKLTILVVDGRRAGYSIGMTYTDLAGVFQRLGCWSAVNLDGGGSTTLVMRDESGVLQVMNRPSDGGELAGQLSIERPTASVVGIQLGDD